MPLIYSRHDPRFHDSRLYKGGDGGAGQMREDEQKRQDKVQAAVDAINGKFGVKGAAAAPDRAAFMNAIPGATGAPGGYSGAEDAPVVAPQQTFDESGFNQAQAQYDSATRGVDDAAGARQKMYDDISGAVRDTALRDLDRQYSKASHDNTFGLARSGLLGGSVDAEAGGQLQELYGEGKLKAEQAGLGAASDLRSTDEKTRQNLISLAQSGIDTGTAGSLAAGQMSAAADLAKSQAAGASVGDLFGNLGQAYLTNKYVQARYPNGPPQAGSTSGYGTSAFSLNPFTGRNG